MTCVVVLSALVVINHRFITTYDALRPFFVFEAINSSISILEYEFNMGDIVQVIDDLTKVRSLQSQEHGNWNEKMKEVRNLFVIHWYCCPKAVRVFVTIVNC